MSKRVILNIGLEYTLNGRQQQVNLVELLELLDVRIPEVFGLATVQSDSERTLVVEIPLDSEANVITLADEICERFHQDAVAIYSEGLQAGILCGPRAAQWGPFNPEYFYLRDNQTLADHIRAEITAEEEARHA